MRRTRASRRRPGTTGPDGPTRVLILSASMGAGHDGAARELARRLVASGHEPEVLDFLDAGPLRIGAALRGGYEFELRHVPSAYDASYRFWYRVPWLCPLIAWLVCALTRRRVLRWVRAARADVVVSTYPLATLCLGRLRRLGRLRVPAVNFITDFGVHPLWVHRGVDLNLAVHPASAAVAAARTGRPAVGCGPQVAAAFDATHDRATQRAALGLAPADLAVLVVAGSWGVGAVEDTITSVAAGGFVPVVVCGRDAALQGRVEDLVARSGTPAVVLGWTDRMPALMAAVDALVENAGGLTAFEAMRCGLPVVSYNPIAGHGVDNTTAMDAAGVSTLAVDPGALAAALAALAVDGPARRRQVAAATAMFSADAAALVVAAEAVGVPRTVAVTRRAARSVASAAAAASLVWVGLTSGVGVAAAEGVGVTTAPSGAGAVAFLAVRLDGAQISDPALIGAVKALHASVVVDARTAGTDAAGVRALVAAGVNVVDGGAGRRYGPGGQVEHPAPWNRADADAAAASAVSRAAGVPVSMYLPGRRIDAWDLYDAATDHLTVVVPDEVLQASPATAATGPLPSLHARGTYLVVGTGASPADVAAELTRLADALGRDHLSAAPLTALLG